MVNFREIVKSNERTFYDHSVGEHALTGSYQWRKLISAFFLALVFSNLVTGFLDIVLSVYAILTGFGFNILFYLLNYQSKEDGESLEKQIITEKVNKLTKELFFNVAYFNLVSVLLIILCMCFYILDSADNGILSLALEYFDKLDLPDFFEKNFNYLEVGVKFSYGFFFYYLLIESMCTFIRITARAFYMFQKVVSS